jgi:YidC/Oxa1 family membrane protein insertase
MVSQFIMQKWMTPAMPQSTDSDNPTAGMTKQLTYMMTFMFGFFTLQVPAGLTLYWVTSNGLQMLQQWAITNDRLGLNKSAPKLTVATATAGNGSSTVAALPEPKKGDGNGAGNAAPGDARANQPSSTSADKGKEARRRRAKRR